MEKTRRDRWNGGTSGAGMVQGGGKDRIFPEPEGLTGGQAAQLLAQHGPNSLTKTRRLTALSTLASQFTSPLVIILIAAAAITGVGLREWTDTAIILAAVMINTGLGFFQEYRASRVLEHLSKLVSPQAKVIRDRRRMEIDAAGVVPGDIVVLEIGRTVPADGVVVRADSLTINEALLTGESVPVAKIVLDGDSEPVISGAAPPSPRLLRASRESDNPDGKKSPAKEAALVSESSVYMGASVASGIGLMRVTATGDRTRMGGIAHTLTTTKKQLTPLQKEVAKLGKTLTIGVVIIVTLMLGLGLIRGEPAREMGKLAVAVAVSAVPEGMAVMLTAILAMGMQRMLKRRALVHKLVSAETLGSVTTICLDKTGTLTEGKMRVVGAEASEFQDSRQTEKQVNRLPGQQVTKPDNLSGLALAALLCNDLRDPLEIAMDKWAREQLGEKVPQIVARYPRADEIPFSPEYKYVATAHPQQETMFVSGAPEVLLKLSDLPAAESRRWQQKFDEFARKGLRLVAVAEKKISRWKNTISHEDINKLRWLGVVLFEDPVREGVAPALAQAQQLGLKLKVITGDYRATTEAVVKKLGDSANVDIDDFLPRGSVASSRSWWQEFARSPVAHDAHLLSVGVPPDVSSGGVGSHRKFATCDRLRPISTLRKSGSGVSDTAGNQVAESLDVIEIEIFARVAPEEKLKIVTDLQAKGEVVAMMGDGVNDAPALAAADIGIVVNDASDVARQAADVVLLDSNFATVTAAIVEGREIMNRLRRVIAYLLSDSLAEVVLITLAVMVGLPLPLTATMVLWINLVTDGLPGIALAVDGEELLEARSRDFAVRSGIKLPFKLQIPSLRFFPFRTSALGLLDGPDGKKLPPKSGSIASRLLIDEKGSALLSKPTRHLIGFVSVTKALLALIAFVSSWMLGSVALGRSGALATMISGSLVIALVLEGKLTNQVVMALMASMALLVVALYLPWLQLTLGTVPIYWWQWIMAAAAAVMVATAVSKLRVTNQWS